MLRLSEAYSSFVLYETLQKLGAPDIVGKKEAIKNVFTMNGYTDFFSPIKMISRKHALLELAKFFDDSKDALSLTKLKNCIHSSKKKLSADEFKKANADRFAVNELAKEFVGISSEDIKEISTLLSANKSGIKKLVAYRNQYLAHDDPKKKEVRLTIKEIYKLFEVTEKILQKFSDKLDFSEWDFSRLKERGESDTKTVITHLRKFREYQMKEIKNIKKD